MPTLDTEIVTDPRLLAAFRIASGQGPIMLRAFHKEQEKILEAFKARGSVIRRSNPNPADRGKLYDQSKILLEAALFRALWDHLQVVRDAFPSGSVLSNAEAPR